MTLETQKSIYLFELKGNNFDTFYFCGHENIVYLGRSYTPIPCEIKGLSVASTGARAQPVLTVADTGDIGLFAKQYNNFLGFELGVLLIRRDLITQNNPIYTPNKDWYVVAQKTQDTPRQSISWKLTPRATINSQVPGRLLLSTCSWKKYRGVGCNYAGTTMFDINNNPTNNPQDDICSLTLEACKLRNNTQNFSGVPTINDFSQ